MLPLSLRTVTEGLTGRLALAVCVVLVLILAPHAATTAAPSPDGWGAQTSGTTWTLYGIWGVSSTDVFAVGESGTILHHDGSGWDSMTSGVTGTLFGVWGSGSADVFAVGQNGLILHYDGMKWSAMTSGTTKHLKGVWGAGSDNVFVVGLGGTILNYNGTSWDNMTSNTGTHLNGVWGSSSSDVFATGATGINGSIMHYDGSNWSQSLPDGHPDFLGIWGASSDNVFAVGGEGTILRYDGASWNDMTTPVASTLNSIWGVSATDIFAVGAEGRVLHYDGNQWSLMDSGVVEGLLSVHGFSPSDVFAAGQVGTILHYEELLPDVTAVSPNLGGQGQTLDVRITGSSLNGATTVSFGSGVSVNHYNCDSSSRITANITIDLAATPGARDVSVTTSNGTDILVGAFTIPSASVASLNPSSGKQGQELDVAILGTNLGGTDSVSFGDGISVSNLVVWSPERLTASISISISASVGTRDVAVNTPDGSAVLPAGFVVVVRDPAIAGVSPSSGNQGQTLDIAIAGVNLGGATEISFGDGIAVNGFTGQNTDSASASITIGATAPIGARQVTVTTPNGIALLANAFTVTAEPPTIVEVSPRSGKIGQSLTISITGANLGSAGSVCLGDGIVIEGLLPTPDLITVNVIISGNAPLGARSLSVITDGGTATLAEGFIVYRLPPGVVGINPASGAPGETMEVVISGVNLTGTTGVDFGDGVKVNSFTVDSDTQITANITVLDGAEGGLHNVNITTSVGSVEFPNGFDLEVVEDPSQGPSSREYSPHSESAGLWWLPLLPGGLVVAILTAALFLIRRKKETVKKPS